MFDANKDEVVYYGNFVIEHIESDIVNRLMWFNQCAEFILTGFN